MRNILGEIEVDDVRYFEELNFHSLHLLEEMREWLTAPAGLPLVLQGDPGSGREYCLQSACYNGQKMYDLPWSVISIDWVEQESRDPQKMAERLQKERPDLSKEHIDWLTHFAETFNLPKGPVMCFDVVSSLIINIPNIVNLIKAIYAEHAAPNNILPGIDPYQRLTWFLEIILKKNNVVLHIRNADQSDLATPFDFLDNICKPLDDEAKAEQQSKQHGRLLFACSCSARTRPPELLGCYNDRILSVFVEAYISEQTLRRRMDRNFSPNRFSDELIASLHAHGRAKGGDRFSFSIRIASVVAELLEKNILMQQGGYWVLNPKTSEQEISKVIGAPLQSLCTDRLNSAEQDLRPTAKRFMELAALCRQWIPVQLLTQYMKLDEERADQLVDFLDDVFVDTEPGLLIDEQYGYPGFAQLCSEEEIAIYRFVSPLLAIARRPGDYQEEAEKLLAFFDERLPKSDRAAAALCWQVAEQANTDVQERWQERLAWYFEPEMAERFSNMLLAKLHAGLVSVDYLLEQANKEKVRQSIWLFKAVISACDRWYEEQGGVPNNQYGALFLHLFGGLLNDLGQYDDALQKYEASLKIGQQVLPLDHPNIAASLNNIGSPLGKLGRHEEALGKYEASLKIDQQVLPPDHPSIATSLNNIGFALGELGRHEEALKKQEAALEMRQKVLPQDHSDIALSLNNIGSTLGDLGRHEEALQKEEAALEMRQKVLPQDHPNIASSLSTIGYRLSTLGRHKEALEKIEAALDIRQRIFPENHEQIAASLNTLGYALNNYGRYKQALAFLQKARTIRERIFPKGHPRLAKTLRYSGDALNGLERYQDALEKYQAALDMQERLLPAEHPETAKTHKLLNECQEKIDAMKP